MSLEATLRQRSEGRCELCKAANPVSVYEVQPQDSSHEHNCALLCDLCIGQIDKKAELKIGHWQVLTETMWSEVPAVQVLAWRMLNRLKGESWAADSLDMLYLDEDTLAWARAAGDADSDGSVDLHKDANGTILHTGDTVVLTRSLDVKGTTLHAKMGTVVKNIRLVENNTEQIEGKIEGQVIVILTKYVRKQGA